MNVKQRGFLRNSTRPLHKVSNTSQDGYIKYHILEKTSYRKYHAHGKCDRTMCRQEHSPAQLFVFFGTSVSEWFRFFYQQWRHFVEHCHLSATFVRWWSISWWLSNILWMSQSLLLKGDLYLAQRSELSRSPVPLFLSLMLKTRLQHDVVEAKRLSLHSWFGTKQLNTN